MNPKILVVDDDPTLNELVRLNLERKGFAVYCAEDGEEALRLAYQVHPDVIILDIMMPRVDGYEVCRRLRALTDVPILFLTAKSRDTDVLRGFDVGADDYMRKPFSLRELEARILALLKRRNRGESAQLSEIFDDGNLRIDLNLQAVYRRGQPIRLTPTEFRLLACLVRDQGKVLTHEEILRKVWGEGYIDAIPTLSLYIRYLREKIEDDPGRPRYIRNKWGVGYWFARPGEE
ncbi:MAG: response regulator transcription factor [Thermanaerothrix sp.]|jgi:DNA-binding response OmpR family regulator|uniref:Response regulator transcription factor n=1 Tax=Thermanaerothrix solaris TaxID=3058434 RepID=A0ABU3NJA3_9CHLR|nr:response regulator transcription factor [Thermanaerothrix sp. 4228-RoL]MDT8896936.1 response regulator transcription factor [Thermanaerothrix sp. 4228-RoL]